MIKNWQEEFNVGLKHDLRGDYVTAQQYKEVQKVSVVTITLGFDKVQNVLKKGH